ncbi:hypothetical protein [Marinobacter sp. VGCF2001]|uniref:hypothetical protein n=1 Tax=Marinobacter sp. VGCF2001 TaxID=3417189 RepID=UPI003CEEBCEC
MPDKSTPQNQPEREKRRFAVSANRGRASHRVRYVETGGAAVDTEECTFCQAVPDLAEQAEAAGASDHGAGHGRVSKDPEAGTPTNDPQPDGNRDH